MEGLEVTVLLGLAILVGTALAPRIRVATPLLLVIIGLLLGFVPQLREIQLPPETVLLLFLPVMLFWESLTTSLRAVRRSLRYIVPMSTLLVVASALAVAWVASLFGMPWPVALLLGAAVAPPDATAVAALGRLLPQRMFMKLKAESLTNDGTALVLYAIALSLALGDSVSAWSVTLTVLVAYLGGAAAGIAVAALAYLALRRRRPAIVINITLLLVPFTAFLLAELVHASGVLAVVFAGLIVAWTLPRITTASSRRQAMSAWPFGVYLLNGALFVLIGLEVQYVVHDIPGRMIGTLLLVTVAAWGALIVVRYLFQLLFAPFSRPAGGAPYSHNRGRIVSTVAGFRGAVSLAIALSVPEAIAGTGDLSGRDAVVFVTAGVILLSLLVQGPLLPAIVRWARMPDDGTAEDEYELAERTISGAAIAALDDLAREHGISDEVRDRIRREGYETLELQNARAYARQRRNDEAQIAELESAFVAPDALDTGSIRAPGSAAGDPATAAAPGARRTVMVEATAAAETSALQMLATSSGIDLTQRSPLARFEEMTRLKLALLDRKRTVLMRLRREGTIDDLVERRVEAHLDLEELRLRGVDQSD
ncbi:MAG: Na+/H+ antiporter [Microbacterium sp. SCN 70-27]|uniref:Na+/H+ antiporter n=1 Tax=unclassified Microbacterium TaxID=2609290 RepID=UPI0008686904|nr:MULTISPECIES: Na+/H+ antiporter [unclassified Microbacterium]MBN9225306.1 Na+/H+ antiporter [Microbacterium sp.]ODT29074.1 MAG: Na+/H+ antiporter [Microbacterium sp. SCN 70-27]